VCLHVCVLVSVCMPVYVSVSVCLFTEFFEELLSLVYSLTSRQISPRMWQILPHLHRLFYDDNIELFVGQSAASDTRFDHVIIVWRIREKITRNVQCCTVYHNCTQL